MRPGISGRHRYHTQRRRRELGIAIGRQSDTRVSLIVEPVSQSLKLRSDPAYGGDVIIGEYQAIYRKFYQKMDDGDNDEKRYNVRIIFRCRVSGGINNRAR